MLVPLLLGLGVDRLSAAVGVLPQVKFLIRRLKTDETKQLVAEILELESGHDIWCRAETLAIAEKTRVLIERSHLSIDDTPLRVTVSVGATMLHQGDSIESAIQRADQLMYQSKSGGRNRVSFAE